MPAACIIKDLTINHFFPQFTRPNHAYIRTMAKCDAIFVLSRVPRPILSGWPQKIRTGDVSINFVCGDREIMTTAARPTFEPARGGRGKGEGDLSALSKQYSSRDLPSHTKLKYR